MVLIAAPPITESRLGAFEASPVLWAAGVKSATSPTGKKPAASVDRHYKNSTVECYRIDRHGREVPPDLDVCRFSSPTLVAYFAAAIADV
jgi:hypothetical protein